MLLQPVDAALSLGALPRQGVALPLLRLLLPLLSGLSRLLRLLLACLRALHRPLLARSPDWGAALRSASAPDATDWQHAAWAAEPSRDIASRGGMPVQPAALLQVHSRVAQARQVGPPALQVARRVVRRRRCFR